MYLSEVIKGYRNIQNCTFHKPWVSKNVVVVQFIITFQYFLLKIDHNAWSIQWFGVAVLFHLQDNYQRSPKLTKGRKVYISYRISVWECVLIIVDKIGWQHVCILFYMHCYPYPIINNHIMVTYTTAHILRHSRYMKYTLFQHFENVGDMSWLMHWRQNRMARRGCVCDYHSNV